MEASVRTERKLDGEKAQRIVAAMRSSVGRRGTAGSTFDHVAAEAGVSRGLLHYYFGSKERLLVEVVRHDCDLRIEALDHRPARRHDLTGLNRFEALEGAPGAPSSLPGRAQPGWPAS